MNYQNMEGIIQRNRKSTRFKGYDYSQPGAYFVTICTHERQNRFGEIVNNTMIFNDNGQLLEYTWNDLPNHNKNVSLDIMPNHIHGIINIYTVGAGSEPAPTVTNEPAPTVASNHGLPEEESRKIKF